MRIRTVFYIGCVVVLFAVVLVSSSADWSIDTWRAIAVGSLTGLLFNTEDRFVRWWNNRRLRRYLGEHEIAHRTDGKA
jgi:hypothetical protein